MSTTPVLIYDGDCGFCTSSAAWIRSRWRGDAQVVAFQALGEAGLAGFNLTTADVAAAVWWIDGDLRRRGARAVAAALRQAGPWWATVGVVIDIVPLRWLAALGYRIVARYRYLLPGSTDACRITR